MSERTKPVQHVQPGDRVLYWPGARVGEGYYGRALSTVSPRQSNNFGTDMVRIEKSTGGTDWIATTHLVVLEPAPDTSSASDTRPATERNADG